MKTLKRAGSKRRTTLAPNEHIASLNPWIRTTIFKTMSSDTETLPEIEIKPETGIQGELDPGYLVICWDDPVNLMDYVTHVFQVVFGWKKERAEKHMLQVHNNGKSILTRETLERAEHYVHELQKYSLHATMERDR